MDDFDRQGPISQAQKMIWVGHQLDPTSPTYNTAWRFDFKQDIDPKIFKQAFAQLIKASDVLRLVIREDSNGAPLLVDLGQPAGLHETVSVEDSDGARQWIDRAIMRPFDLRSESFHSALIRIGEDGWTWYLNQHHAIVDASSGSLLLGALSEIYSSGESKPLPSFMDHVFEQSRRSSASDAAHWDAPSRGTGSPRLFGKQVSGRSSAAVMRHVELGAERCARLNDMIKTPGFRSISRDMALFNLFLTALTAWLHRIAGETTLPVGIVTHGRSSPTSRITPGCFIELFPMALDCTPESSFRQLHTHVVERSLDLFRKTSPGSSSPAALNGFNTVLNFISTRFGTFAGETPTITWLDNGRIDPHHALRLNVMEFDEKSGLACAFAFNEEVFDKASQQAAIDQFFRLLDAFLADPDAAVSAVPLGSASEASTRLTQASLNSAPVPDVIDAFQGHLAADPDKPILYEGDRAFSRRNLADRVDSFVAAFAGMGVGPGDRVGLHLTRSCDLVAAMLAALKLNAGFVPLDPSQTPNRLDAIAGQAKLRLTVTDPALAAFWQPPGATLTPADITVAETPPTAASPDHPAYVIFTSGTTGIPKGVVVGRAALSRYADWANRVFADNTPAAWPLFSAIGFDLTITSIFAPIIAGGSIRIYPDTPGAPSTTVLDVFKEDAVDVVKLTPAHLRLVLAGKTAAKSRIKALVLGGEDLSTDLAAAARTALGAHIRIFNEYGPTEATVGCMIHEFDPSRDTGASIPIGQPAEATGIYILDKGLSPVPDNVPGELHIAGSERLALGYFERPDETDASFIDNPFGQGKMYRSGDIASVRPDGTILYHGRADQQIKINGVRIETGEIRAAAQSVEGVDDSALIMFDPKAASEKLCRVCGIPKSQPGVSFAEPDLCRTCKEFHSYKTAVDSYFGDLDELTAIIRSRAEARTGDYDCVMLLSGGKDSTYALSRLMDITDRVLVATLDNGFISEGAKENIRTITERLGVEHRFLSTPAMNDIFVDSLKRHANVCQGCFKTIYTLGLRLARDVGAPTIVTGLSRGQLFETRLAPELFASGAAAAADIDRMVLEARRSYHLVPDVAAKRLNEGLFDDPALLDRIAFVDFYRYCDVDMSEMYRHLEQSVGWSRPMDTGRSTNCLINDVGIHVHRTRRAYHNYALPYSWDVRLGHKTRKQAVDELDDDIDGEKVQAILDEIGFDEPIEVGSAPGTPELVLYYTSSTGLLPGDLRASLARRLPRDVLPKEFVAVPAIPLTPNGKLDTDALPTPDLWRAADTAQSAPGDDSALSDVERQLLDIWRRVLGRIGLGAKDNFYDAGGDSLSAIQIASQANAAGIALGPQDIFRHQTVADIAAHLPAPEATPQEVRAPARRALSSRNAARLEALFGRKTDG